MALSSRFRMADRLVDGRLADLLGTYRSEGLSWDEISRRLYAESGVEVSAGTLSLWAIELGVVNPDGSAIVPATTEPAEAAS